MRRLRTLVLNLQFWTLFFAVSAAIMSLYAVVVTAIRLTRSRRVTLRRLRRAISWYGACILRCGYPWARVRYVDLAPQEREGPFIFVCNHRSASDPFMMACLPFECIQVVNVWPFRLPFLGAIAKLAGYLSVRAMPVETFYEKAGQLLQQGVCVIAFPEGTRSVTRQAGPFNSSIFRLAERERAAIVPIVLSGTEDMPHKGSLALHPGVVRVHKLPACRWEEYREMTTFQLKNHVRDLICQHLAEIEGRAP